MGAERTKTKEGKFSIQLDVSQNRLFSAIEKSKFSANMRSAGTKWEARRLTAASLGRIESNLKVWALKLKSLQEFEGLYIAIGQKAAG